MALTIEQELYNKTIAAGLAVATVKLISSGQQAIVRPEGSDELDVTVLVNTLVAASIEAANEGNGTASEVMAAIAALVTSVNNTEQAAKAAKAAGGKV